jgi:hypothetical protein
MIRDPAEGIGRRNVLQVFAVGALAAMNTGCEPMGPDREADAQKDKPRYRVTEHVKRFYQVNEY